MIPAPIPANEATRLKALHDLLVLDRHTVNPPVPYIVAVKSDLSYVQRTLPGESTTKASKKDIKSSSTSPTFSVSFERLHGKSKAVITALPIELCLNKECIQTILNSFARPVNKHAVRETTKVKKVAPKPQNALSTAQMGIENLRNVSQHNDDIELILQASAPKIIIPESSEDSGYVLVDCGNIEIRGFLGELHFLHFFSLWSICRGETSIINCLYVSISSYSLLSAE